MFYHRVKKTGITDGSQSLLVKPMVACCSGVRASKSWSLSHLTESVNEILVWTFPSITEVLTSHSHHQCENSSDECQFYLINVSMDPQKVTWADPECQEEEEAIGGWSPSWWHRGDIWQCLPSVEAGVLLNLDTVVIMWPVSGWQGMWTQRSLPRRVWQEKPLVVAKEACVRSAFIMASGW